MAYNILEIRDVCKAYGEHKALDHVSLNVEQGSVFGLLGPNGAGKTTLLRIINSILVHDSGSVLIDGLEAALGKTSHLLGYMPEERGLYPKMRVEEQILFFGQLKGRDKASLVKRMNEYTDIFQISRQDRHRKVEELSKGNQQKVQIISTIVHDPKLIILDEPFSGFDPINGQLLSDLIERLHEHEATIILSSHNMPAVEDMASHVALVNHGRLLINGQLDDIKESNKPGTLELVTASELAIPTALASGAIADLQAVQPRDKRRGFHYLLRPAAGRRNNEVLDSIAMQSDILYFAESLPSLADLFIKFVADSESKAAPADYQTLTTESNNAI